MAAPISCFGDADWLSWPADAREFVLIQQEQIDQHRMQLTSLATELANLRERIGRSSRNSSKSPPCDGLGFKPPELLPIELVDEVVEHHPDSCRSGGTLLEGDEPDPLPHQVIEIPPITPLVIEHRLHCLVCPCCSTSTCATLPADVEASHYGPRLSALVGLLGSAFPLSFSKTQALLQQRLSAALAEPTAAIPTASGAGSGSWSPPW